MIIVICLFKEVSKFKENNESVNFHNQFCLGSRSNKFDEVEEAEEMPLKGIVHDFSVDYDTISKSGILNIYKYLVVKKNDIK